MSTEILQLLINSSGAALVTAIFVWYLKEHGKQDELRAKRQDEIIQKYLHDSTQADKEHSAAMQRFSDTIQALERSNTELKEVIHKLYKELVEKAKILKDYKNANA